MARPLIAKHGRKRRPAQLSSGNAQQLTESAKQFRTELRALPGGGDLLLVIFRSPVIALLPIILIGIVSQIANGLISWVVKLFGMQTDASILIVVLFGVGTDYILFLMFRFRERLRAGDEPKQAMVTAVSGVGEAITSAVTLLAGLTLVPAVVSLLGAGVF
ncbi:hypothetical protein GCM10017786_45190 [Amycolatopsis deserti]|uniref:Membrane transport protein MMPL domain-containing protein n=1 Tax=Amycolatopsis deserti TaxID=185696 RepID=A0ABQ3J6X7_9PSEU|nr:MMPL family transporter [Amycolatopsis deserti]GHF06582.1 hypothetical protein GCM10017786_45190 [Amycolatopsis deserti]